MPNAIEDQRVLGRSPKCINGRLPSDSGSSRSVRDLALGSGSAHFHTMTRRSKRSGLPLRSLEARSAPHPAREHCAHQPMCPLSTGLCPATHCTVATARREAVSQRSPRRHCASACVCIGASCQEVAFHCVNPGGVQCPQSAVFFELIAFSLSG